MANPCHTDSILKLALCSAWKHMVAQLSYMFEALHEGSVHPGEAVGGDVDLPVDYVLEG